MSEFFRGFFRAILWTLAVVGALLMALVVLVTLRLLWRMMGFSQ